MKKKMNKTNKYDTDGFLIIELARHWVVGSGPNGSTNPRARQHSSVLFIYLFPSIFPQFWTCEHLLSVQCNQIRCEKWNKSSLGIWISITRWIEWLKVNWRWLYAIETGGERGLFLFSFFERNLVITSRERHTWGEIRSVEIH